ncbi:hypothetical protein V8G54_000493 [Vigna mungo]|uniref:Calcineurin-like phosphoesterase domain-containing protein n=1 Tax=Vigna mungo TaxID=3915 RepID=A0AAQ3SAV5_VIGMU
MDDDFHYSVYQLFSNAYSTLSRLGKERNLQPIRSCCSGCGFSSWIAIIKYSANLKNSAEIAEFFFVDTTPFVDKYFLEPKDHKYDWRGVLPRERYLSKLLKDLEIALKGSSANWKIVVGHHTIRSIGHHGDTQELINQLLPILEANDVDMYINGHDHCLEHIISTSSQIQFLTSGGGSKAWRGDINKNRKDGTKFYYDGQGFMSVELEQTNAKVVYYDIYGNVLHVVNLSKALRSVYAI